MHRGISPPHAGMQRGYNYPPSPWPPPPTHLTPVTPPAMPNCQAFLSHPYPPPALNVLHQTYRSILHSLTHTINTTASPTAMSLSSDQISQSMWTCALNSPLLRSSVKYMTAELSIAVLLTPATPVLRGTIRMRWESKCKMLPLINVVMAAFGTNKQ